MVQDAGVSIWEAVERWTPQALWQRYREIAREEIPVFFPRTPNPLSDEARRLRTAIERILTDMFCRGELIASGLHLPLHESTRPRDVSSELWSRLKLDLRSCEASGDGLRVVELRVRETGPPKPEPPPAAMEAKQPAPRPARGRPSIMSEIEAEMRRRAHAGQLEPFLSREAGVLAIWARNEFSDRHVPKPESIEKKLGKLYKELKPTKRPDK